MSRTEIGQSRSETSIPRQTLSDFGTHSLSFDGVDDVVTVAHPFFDYETTDDLTVIWRGYIEDFITKQCLWGKSFNNRIYVENNVFTFQWYDGTTSNLLQVTNFPELAKGKFVEIVTVVESKVRRIYINGVLVKEQDDTAYTGSIKNTDNFTMGDVSSDEFRGYQSSQIIIEKALTTQQIQSLYYNKTVPRENLVAEYFRSIDTDGAGTVLKDTSGNGNDGTITGATWSTDVPYQPRQDVIDDRASLSFDGSGDYIGDFDGLNLSGSFTLGSVFIGTSLIADTGFAPRLIGFDVGFRPYVGFDSGKLQFVVRNTSDTNQTLSSPNKIKVGEWYDVIAVYNNSNKTMSMYIDGVLVNSLVISGDIKDYSSVMLEIGRLYNDGTKGRLTGNIKKTLIWNTALTPKQIYDLHFNNIIPKDNLVLNLKMNEGAGLTVYDTSGNGNNGTITGATWSDDVPSPARGDVIC